MEVTGKYLSLSVVLLVLCSVSVKTEREINDSDIDPDSLNLILNPKLLRALSELLNPSAQPPVDPPVDSKPAESRRKRFTPSSRVDSKVTKLKTPKSDHEDADVPVIQGLAGLSPIELRLLNEREEQDDGKLIRTTTQKARTEKSAHKKKDDDHVPIITGTNDANNPSRQQQQEARAGKSADDDNTVVLLNGATAQRAPASPAPPQSYPPTPRPSFRPPQHPPYFQSPPSLGGRTRCQQKKLLLQLDEQLAVLRKLNEQREADIARSMSWVDGAGTAHQIPNVPIPYYPYVSNLPIYGRSDWTPLPLQPSYEYQVSGNRGPPIAGIYRRTWVPTQVPIHADTIDCDYEDDRTLHHPGGIVVSTPAPNTFQGPRLHQGNPGGIFVSTSAPDTFRRPGFDNRNLRYPGGYGIPPTPGTLRRDGYGRVWASGIPRVEVDDKVAKPEDDPAEDEEKE